LDKILAYQKEKANKTGSNQSIALIEGLATYVKANYDVNIALLSKVFQKTSKVVSEGKPHIEFPDNIRLLDYLYYQFCAPVLTYETYYPRNQRIRKRFVLKKLAQLTTCALIMHVIVVQYLLPAIKQPSFFIIDILKLVIPSFVCWLLMFYSIFHVSLNLMGELFRFADRGFYTDWWNSTTLAQFWRKWNFPVHEWCLRHVYVESIHYFKVSKKLATFFTFLISAILHEFLMLISFKMLRPWFLLAMIGQVPLVYISSRFKHERFGNIIMWLSLMFGQPVIEVLYVRDWINSHESKDFYCI